jgi:hypothetical protein
MVRNASKTSKTTEVPTTVQEDTVTTAVEETTEVPTKTVTEAPAVEAVAEVEVDLTAFKEAVEASRASTDGEGGFTDEAAMQPILAAYAALADAKAKSAARKWLETDMKEKMGTGKAGFVPARTNMLVRNALSAAKAPKAPKEPKAPKAPVDPTEAFLDQYCAARVAVGVIAGQAPEGIAENWLEQARERIAGSQAAAQAYQAYLVDESEGKVVPEGTPAFVVAGFKIADGKAAGKPKKSGTRAATSGGYSGPSRDVLAHIRSAFEGKSVGDVLSVGEIRNATSAEYGDDRPSQGAISARINGAKFAAQAPEFEVVNAPKLGLKKIA